MEYTEEFEGIEFEGKVWNCRHGGPFDRGSADSYYGRPENPHYFVGKTGDGLVTADEMTSKEMYEYNAGYRYNEMFGEKKDWGRA